MKKFLVSCFFFIVSTILIFGQDAKFKGNTEPFFSYQNPAYLGIMNMDRFHLSFGGSFLGHYIFTLLYPEGGWVPVSGYDDTVMRENDGTFYNFGYSFPIGEKLGLGVEAFMSYISTEMITGFSLSSFSRLPFGGTLNFGWLLGENISIGIGISIFNERDFIWGDSQASVAYGGNIGLLIRNTDETFIFDSRVGYSTFTTVLYDNSVLPPVFVKFLTSPIFNENTLTFGLNQKKTFIVLKQVNDISIDRIYYYGKILPIIEHFFADWFSTRLGVEGALVVFGDKVTLGYGVSGGITFRIVDWGFDIDINVSYRMKPSRLIDGMIPEILLMFGLDLSDVFISRGK